jgi:hypothetical protein
LKLQEHDLGMFDLLFFTCPHTGVPNDDPNNVPWERQRDPSTKINLSRSRTQLREFLASATSTPSSSRQ